MHSTGSGEGVPFGPLGFLFVFGALLGFLAFFFWLLLLVSLRVLPTPDFEEQIPGRQI